MSTHVETPCCLQRRVLPRRHRGTALKTRECCFRVARYVGLLSSRTPIRRGPTEAIPRADGPVLLCGLENRSSQSGECRECPLGSCWRAALIEAVPLPGPSLRFARG